MNMNLDQIKGFLGPDLATYDPYDLWKTGLGMQVKRLYYKGGRITLPIVAPFYLLDAYAPRLVRLFIRPQEFPIVRAFAILSALNVYKITAEKKYLDLAAESVKWLIDNQSVGYRGACWGLNMPWMTKSGYSPAATPFISITPYCVEALLAFSDVSKDNASRDVALSSLDFVENHLHRLVDSHHELAVSYGPEYGTRIVINGSSYAMMLYALLASRLPEKQNFLSQKAMRLFNFISSRMNPDGSWFYYADNKNGNFIDCFHSCFILKNICKYGKLTNADVSDIVDRGLIYLLSNFLDDKKYLARRFMIACNPSLTKFDLYDQAELLNVLLMTGRLDTAKRLYNSIMDNFFIVNKNTFGQQIDIFGFLHKTPYLRWAIMPMIYTLSEYYKLSNLCNIDSSNADSAICS